MFIVHLYSQGISDTEMTNFDLSLVNPSTIYEQEKVNLWSEKIRLVKISTGLNMLSKEWVYENIFKMSNEEIDRQKGTLINDLKDRFRYRSIEDEGRPDTEEDDPTDVEESLGVVKERTKR